MSAASCCSAVIKMLDMELPVVAAQCERFRQPTEPRSAAQHCMRIVGRLQNELLCAHKQENRVWWR